LECQAKSLIKTSFSQNIAVFRYSEPILPHQPRRRRISISKSQIRPRRNRLNNPCQIKTLAHVSHFIYFTSNKFYGIIPTKQLNSNKIRGETHLHINAFTHIPIESRATYLRAYKAPSLHLSSALYKSPPFMQNKANFRKTKMNLNSYSTMAYENNLPRPIRKNKPKQTQSPAHKTTYDIPHTTYEIQTQSPATVESAKMAQKTSRQKSENRSQKT